MWEFRLPSLSMVYGLPPASAMLGLAPPFPVKQPMSNFYRLQVCLIAVLLLACGVHVYSPETKQRNSGECLNDLWHGCSIWVVVFLICRCNICLESQGDLEHSSHNFAQLFPVNMDDSEGEFEPIDDIPAPERRKKTKMRLAKQIRGEFQTFQLSL